jgi:hypothetical protein
MNTQGIPSCEWPDARRGATFRNCYDKDGRVDNNLREIAAKKRIKEIREHPNAGSGLHEALGRWDGSEGGSLWLPAFR